MKPKTDKQPLKKDAGEKTKKISEIGIVKITPESLEGILEKYRSELFHTPLKISNTDSNIEIIRLLRKHEDVLRAALTEARDYGGDYQIRQLDELLFGCGSTRCSPNTFALYQKIIAEHEIKRVKYGDLEVEYKEDAGEKKALVGLTKNPKNPHAKIVGWSPWIEPAVITIHGDPEKIVPELLERIKEGNEKMLRGEPLFEKLVMSEPTAIIQIVKPSLWQRLTTFFFGKEKRWRKRNHDPRELPMDGNNYPAQALRPAGATPEEEGFCMIIGKTCYPECPHYYYRESNRCYNSVGRRLGR